ncbi:hypothetical protein [Streptomyces sp. SAI-229]|uniref:hypothetical protein n=1 Tax=Streptomyces sp. SAI-229 TaxID=3377731 RepID=UPI003C7A7BCD
MAESAARRTTRTPTISSVVAPERTASNIAWQFGEGVWWTISRVGTPPTLPCRSACPQAATAGVPL